MAESIGRELALIAAIFVDMVNIEAPISAEKASRLAALCGGVSTIARDVL